MHAPVNSAEKDPFIQMAPTICNGLDKSHTLSTIHVINMPEVVLGLGLGLELELGLGWHNRFKVCSGVRVSFMVRFKVSLG